MTNGDASKKKSHGRLWMALAVVVLLVLALVVPPLISVSHYKGQITHLIAQSLGRPVRLSSVEVRLLPWPGFVLYDLSVAEDPAYGAEPVLHASKVTASLRLLALWRGRLEIDKISVDDASLNLVRAGAGAMESRSHLPHCRRPNRRRHWRNRRVRRTPPERLPSLEATNSRINFKNGAEKLPFSLLNADISFWQESPGEWRIRLRGAARAHRRKPLPGRDRHGAHGGQCPLRSRPARDAGARRPRLARRASGPARPHHCRLRSRLARRP